MSGDPTVPALDVVTVDELLIRRGRLQLLRNVIRELRLLELEPADDILAKAERLRNQVVQVRGACITCDGPMYTSVKVDSNAMPREKSSGICADCDSKFAGKAAGGVVVIDGGFGEASGV